MRTLFVSLYLFCGDCSGPGYPFAASLPIAPSSAIRASQLRDHLTTHLCNHRRSSGTLVSPVRWQYTDRLVVSAETVDSGFDENEAEL